MECQKSGSRRSVNYGYGELLEAAVYEEDGVTLVEKTEQVGHCNYNFYSTIQFYSTILHVLMSPSIVLSISNIVKHRLHVTTITLQLGQEGLAFKVNKEYVVRAKFIAKKFSSFGSYPKFMGIKMSEKFVAASENTKQAYKSIFR